MITDGFEVEFECGHKAVYDKYSQHGIPELGQLGRCHACDTAPKPNAGVDRRVIAMRQCWIETITRVHFENPNAARLTCEDVSPDKEKVSSAP